MNIQQLEYLLAVDKYKHFGKAAQACFITQPTLSAMVQKIEDELEAKIFDRTSHPIRTTDFGKEILKEVQRVLDAINHLKDRALELNDTIAGTLNLGIIPTISSFILPTEIYNFLQENDRIKIQVVEMTTENIIRSLKEGKLDAGIISTPHPLAEEFFHDSLFNEELLLYASDPDKLSNGESYIAPENIPSDEVWLLEEGNCLKHQAENVCHLKENRSVPKNLAYKAGNIHTLIQLVDRLGGMTILPEMAISQLNEVQKKHVRHFRVPFPYRTVSMVYYKPTYKQKVIDALSQHIRKELDGQLSYSKHPQDFHQVDAG